MYIKARRSTTTVTRSRKASTKHGAYFLCFCWLSWLMVVRARFKLFGNIIWQVSPMF